jgi:hypothetical protein
MKKTLLLCTASFLAASLLIAAEFKVYPGAKVDEELTKMRASMKNSRVYVTSDSFDKVYSFYKGIATEDMESKKTVEGVGANTAPDGQPIKRAYFNFDGAKVALLYPRMGRGKPVVNATLISFVPENK